MYNNCFRVGDEVIVIKEDLKSCGWKGRIVNNCYNTNYGTNLILVEFDNDYCIENYGKTRFAYNQRSLAKISGHKSESTNGGNKMMILDGYDKIAQIELGVYGKNYSFALYDSENYSVGDKVIVNPRGEYCMGVISEITSKEKFVGNVDITAEVICKIDDSEYLKRVDNRKRRKELLDKMKKKADKIKEMQYFEILAKEDSELAEMMNEYKELESEK
jgi:hypothetical protein